jgi:single-strand DNA-binding protein
MNLVILMGRLTRDPECKFTSNQTAICTFSIATNKKWKTTAGEAKEKVTFTEWTAFGKTGEMIAKHFHKGKTILVEGEVDLEQWQDKEGSQRSKIKFILRQFHFVGDSGTREKPSGQAASAPAAKAQEINDADIPF